MKSFSVQTSAGSKLIGWILILAALFGWVISLGGLAALWSSRTQVTQGAVYAATTAYEAMDATNNLLTVAGNSLANAGDNLQQIQKITAEVGLLVKNTGPVFKSISTLLGEDLPKVLTSTQDSLTTLEETAGVVDSTLRLVSNIPFISKEKYDPKTPLNESIAGISASMEGLPESFQNLQKNLDTSTSNLDEVAVQMDKLSTDLGSIQKNIADAGAVVEQYRSIVLSLQGNFDQLRETIPGAVTAAYTVFSLLLAWLALAQLGLFTQGLERINRQKMSVSEIEAPEEKPAD